MTQPNGEPNSPNLADMTVQSRPPDGRLQALLTFLIPFAALFAVGVTFAGLTPLSASPDEPEHWRQAYAVWDGQANYFESDPVYAVPTYLVGYPAQCTYQQTAVTASCATPIIDNGRRFAKSSARGYPWVHYIATGWVTKVTSGKTALYGMRIAGAALFAALIAGAIMVVRGSARSWRRTLTLLLAATPSVLFLGGTMNPNGTEVAFVILVAALTWRCLQEFGGPRFVRWGAALAVAAVLGAGVRALSPVLVAMAIAAIMLGSPQRPGKRIIAYALGLAAVLVAGLLLRYGVTAVRMVFADTSEASEGDGEAAAPEAWQPYLIRSLWIGSGGPQEWVGLMGWLDAGANSVSTAAWFIALGMVVFAVVDRVPRRALLAAGLTLLAATMMWLVLDNVLSRSGGIPFWQVRYAAPLFAIAISSVGLWAPPHDDSRGRWLLPSIAAGLMGIATGVAATLLLIRYGWAPDWRGPLASPTWLPLGANSVLIYLALFVTFVGVPIAALGPGIAERLAGRGRQERGRTADITERSPAEIQPPADRTDPAPRVPAEAIEDASRR